jgi:hypothetical protein
MEALNAKLAELNEREKAVLQKKDELEHEEVCIERERQELEEERLQLSQKLTPDAELNLRKELTALGELFELVAVIHAFFEVDPILPSEDPRDLYKITINTEVTFDSGLTGLYVRASIKTLSPAVEAVVRSLFIQEGHCRDRPSNALTWEKHWDYGTRISLTTHEALS